MNENEEVPLSDVPEPYRSMLMSGLERQEKIVEIAKIQFACDINLDTAASFNRLKREEAETDFDLRERIKSTIKKRNKQ